MLTAGQLNAIQCAQRDLATIETHAKRINAMVSTQRIEIAWLKVSDRTIPYAEALEHLLAEHEKEAHAAAARSTA